MARIRLVLPAKSIGSFMIPVRITDINYGNHTGNNAIVEIIHEARMQLLDQYGYTELNAAGTGLIMSELLVEFKQEAFYRDLLDVKIFPGEISKKTFELFYQLTALRSEKQIIVAHAKTTMVCYSYKEKRVESLPEALRSILL